MATLRRSLLVLATLLLLAPPASAAVVVREQYAPVAGPVLHGPDGVAWLARDERGEMAVHVRSSAGEAVPFRLRTAPGRRLFSASLAADGAYVAAGWVESNGLPDAPTVTTRVFAGPGAGSLAAVRGPCTTSLISQGSYAVALSGGQLAAAGPSCAERSVTDLSTGQRVLALPPASDDFRREGAFIAWSERRRISAGTDGDAIEVRNVETGAGFQIPPRLRTLALGAIDVDAAGNVAFLYSGWRGRERGRSVLGWASPEQPELRTRLLPRGMQPSDLRLSAGVAAILHMRAGGPPDDARVALTPLHPTAPLRVVATGLHISGDAAAPLDFDGERLAVASAPCGRVDLIVARVGDPALLREPSRRCPLRLAERPRLTARALIASIRCDGYRLRCDADSLRATTVPGGHTIARDRHDGTQREVRMRLTRPGRKLARRGKVRRVRLTAELGDYVDPRRRDRLHSTITRVRR